MGADIWLGEPWGPLHFRETYMGPVLLNYLGLSYWNDLNPRVTHSKFPLELNDWLEKELIERAAGKLGPDGLDRAAAYCRENGHYPRGTSEERYIGAVMDRWVQDYDLLLKLLRESTRRKEPLTMSL